MTTTYTDAELVAFLRTVNRPWWRADPRLEACVVMGWVVLSGDYSYASVTVTESGKKALEQQT